VIQSLAAVSIAGSPRSRAFRDVQAEITVIPARLSMSRRVEPLPRQGLAYIAEDPELQHV